MPSYTISDEEVATLMKPVVGKGGFQRLIRRLQKGISGNQLSVSEEDMDTIERYIERCGLDGGWQRQIPYELKLDVATRPAEPPT